MIEAQEKQMTEDEIDEIVTKIFEAEERGDIREAEILKTKIPFDENFVSFFRGIYSEEVYNEFLAGVKEYRETKNQEILKKYSVI